MLGGVINTGAPRAICNARAPIILARSNLVSLGGPIRSLIILPQLL
ncbi:MAG: hypothetical protein N3E48_00035 [Candidatus Bathyarchaeota archaeon]|nr:hypothetical protein [Candidatus Bathyarchaeota archaeon]